MNDKELGPCPLCGGEARELEGEVKCSNLDCEMPWMFLGDWLKLSALAAQNRRRGEEIKDLCRERQDLLKDKYRLREALERCRKFAAASIKDVFVPPSEEAMKNMARMCEEALK